MSIFQQRYIDSDEPLGLTYEEKSGVAETFLDSYDDILPEDLYRWLWEGEFGPGRTVPPLTLDQLAQDIRLARIQGNGNLVDVWEPAGLADKYVRVNLLPYVDRGCPLKRLIAMGDRSKELKADPLRMKQDWEFLKTQIIPGMLLTMDQMRAFELSIPFHITPEINYSKKYVENYGLGFRIVPRVLFLTYFPEYSNEMQSDWLRWKVTR